MLILDKRVFLPFNENIYLIKHILLNIDSKISKEKYARWIIFLNFMNAPPTSEWGGEGDERSFSNPVIEEWEGKKEKIKRKHLRGIDSQVLKASCLSFNKSLSSFESIYLLNIHLPDIDWVLTAYQRFLGCCVIKMYKTSFVTYRAQTN